MNAFVFISVAFRAPGYAPNTLCIAQESSSAFVGVHSRVPLRRRTQEFRGFDSDVYPIMLRSLLSTPIRITPYACHTSNDISRRTVFRRILSAVTATAVAAYSSNPTSVPRPALATLHEQAADLAAAIPGVGPPDVFFPDFFLGEWDVTRELYSVEPPPASIKAAGRSGSTVKLSTAEQTVIEALRARIGMRDSYRERFIEHREHVVADRAFNARQELQAELAPKRASVRAMWSADNPNILTLTSSTGGPGSSPNAEAASENSQSRAGNGRGNALTREVKVTKRSVVDGPQGYGTFITSEYARVVDVGNGRGLLSGSAPPEIYAMRRITRYRASSIGPNGVPDQIDALCVEYRYPASPPNAPPTITTKYREFFDRKGRKGALAKSHLNTSPG